MPIHKPILTIINNDDNRFDEDDRAYWPYKIIQMNKIKVNNAYREIFINKDFDLVGFSNKGSRWINPYKKENADGSVVEISNRGFKYLIFQKSLKNSIAVMPPPKPIDNKVIDMTSQKLIPEIGKTYTTKNGALVKLVASEYEGTFAKQFTFIGLIRRPEAPNGATPYQCDAFGKVISHGEHEHYDLVEEHKVHTVYTYTWIHPGFDKNNIVSQVIFNSNELPKYLQEHPDIKYNLSISTSSF